MTTAEKEVKCKICGTSPVCTFIEKVLPLKGGMVAAFSVQVCYACREGYEWLNPNYLDQVNKEFSIQVWDYEQGRKRQARS